MDLETIADSRDLQNRSQQIPGGGEKATSPLFGGRIRKIEKHFETRADDAFAKVLHAARTQRPEGEPGLVELVATGAAPAIDDDLS